MENKHINLRKLDRLADLAFKNGLRLHEDSICLYELQSYPSSYLLSVLSLEEFGKSIVLEDYLWKKRDQIPYDSTLDIDFITKLYQHKIKQRIFALHIDFPDECRKVIQEIYDGKVEIQKHNATYVGLPRKNGKIDYKGQIISPFKIREKKVAEQITIVNDFIIVLALGCIKGTQDIDIAGLQEIFTHDLINKLREKWPKMSKLSKRQFLQISKFDDLELEDRGLKKHPK